MRKVIFLSTVYFLLSTSVLAQSVDILWQGDTYTPPFYEGKSLWSNQSWITLVAIHQGLGNPASLNYKWTKNGTVLGLVSGVGEETLAFMDTVFSKPQSIKVEIISPEEYVLAESSIVVAPRARELLVYEKNPLYGYIFNREVKDLFRMKDNEITFAVFPLFSTSNNRDDTNLFYKWRTNDGEVETGNLVTYRMPEGEKGSSVVNITLSNKEGLLRDANREFLVQFGENDEQ